jgi:cysteine synthase
MGLAIAAWSRATSASSPPPTSSRRRRSTRCGLRRRGHRLPDRRGPRGPAVVLLGVVSRSRARHPNSWKANQYDNPSNNAQAHYEQTGPRSGSRPTGASTTWSSASAPAARSAASAKYLKEKKPSVKVWGIDTYGSVFKKYKETGVFDKNEIYPYITEGIGEDFLPKNVDFSSSITSRR